MRQDGVKVLMAVVKGVCVDSHCGEEKRREEKRREGGNGFHSSE